jgi:galactitol-specific phosphotransferase system IIB component
MKKIGIERALSDIGDYLSKQGYSVQVLNESTENSSSKFSGLDAIVSSDYDTDALGYSDTETKVPVINASGMTAEDVKKMLDREFKNR